MKVTFLVVNGILTKPSDLDGWTDIFEDFYQNLGIPCNRYEYFSGAITRFLKQAGRVEDLVHILKRITSPLVFVGHSNGCELFCKLLEKTGRTFEAAHLFAPAVDSDFTKNGLNEALAERKVKRLFLYCSKNDRILRDIASKTSFLKFIGIGYGTLGYTGPQNVLTSVDDKLDVTWEDRYGHSDWFKHENIDRSFSMTLRGFE